MSSQTKLLNVFSVAALLVGCGANVQTSRTTSQIASAAETTSKTDLLDPALANSQLHVVSIYESRSDHSGPDNHPAGETTVTVRGGHNNVLFLSSYEPTVWKLKTLNHSKIKKVILNGYCEQKVEGVDQSLVESHTYLQNGKAVSLEFPEDGSWNESRAITAAAEALVGMKAVSTQGAYRANDVSVGANRKVFAVSLYEAKNAPTCANAQMGNRCGNATVKVYAEGYVDLFLSAYEPVTWNLVLGPKTVIKNVYLTGYYRQAVTGMGPTAVVSYADHNSASGYVGFFPTAASDSKAASFIAKAEKIADAPLTNFIASYYGRDDMQFGRAP